jgi:hypothetical protein
MPLLKRITRGLNSELWANFIEQVYPSQSGLTFENISNSPKI